MTRTPEQVLKNLEAVAEIFKDSNLWIKGQSKYTRLSGETCYCLTGALGQVISGDAYSAPSVYTPEIQALDFFSAGATQRWNDAPGRTINEIRERLNLGIERVKQQILTGEPDVSKIPLTRVPMETQANIAAKATANTPPVDLQAVHDDAAAKPGNTKPKALKLKAAGPGIRRYPKGHPLGGKFVPADVTDLSIPAHETRVAYKGFNTDGTNNIFCKNVSFKVGELIEVQNSRPIKLCENGFHACENPFAVFNYYSLTRERRFGKVTLHGPFHDANGSGDKIAAKGITVDEIMSWPHLLNALAKYAKEHKANDFIKERVAIDSSDNKYYQLNVVDNSYGVQSQDGGAATRVQMSNVPYACQRAFNAPVQMAFGEGSVQVGSGWQVSWGNRIQTTSINGGNAIIEVYGKASSVISYNPYARIKGVEGTKVTIVSVDQQAVVKGVIGKDGLEPDKWIDVGIRTAPSKTELFLRNTN